MILTGLCSDAVNLLSPFFSCWDSNNESFLRSYTSKRQLSTTILRSWTQQTSAINCLENRPDGGSGCDIRASRGFLIAMGDALGMASRFRLILASYALSTSRREANFFFFIFFQVKPAAQIRAMRGLFHGAASCSIYIFDSSRRFDVLLCFSYPISLCNS